MAIPVKPLAEMIRAVIGSLQTGTRGGRPVYTLLLGSGFSYPIVPTPTQMLKSDAIAGAIDDLQAEMAKRPDLPGAERALALLETAAAQNRPVAEV